MAAVAPHRGIWAAVQRTALNIGVHTVIRPRHGAGTIPKGNLLPSRRHSGCLTAIRTAVIQHGMHATSLMSKICTKPQ